MKPFEFKQQQKQWDRYRCFHAYEGPFVEFETGEVILSRAPAPHEREMYSRYGIRLVSTSDGRWCPDLYLDKDCTQHVKPAWVTQGGQQVIAIDYEQRVATKVRTGWGVNKDTLQFLGRHLQSAAAVWTGHERLPIPLAKITVSVPDRTVRKELAEKLEDVRAAVTAAARMKGLSYSWYGTKMTAQPKWADMSVEDICADVCACESTMRMVASNGFAFPRAETRHDFLYIK